MEVLVSDPFDVLTMGRVGVDLYPTTPGSLVDVRFFEKFLGGSPANVAVAAARLGQRSAIISRTGGDSLGEFIHSALRGYGVDDQFVRSVDGFQTPITLCELFPPDHFPLLFYRSPKAPDLEIFPDELDASSIESARLFWATGSGLSVEPSRSTTMSALRLRRRRHPTVLDLDYRPTFWPSRKDARDAVADALDLVTVAIGNLDEMQTAVATTDPELAVERLLQRGVTIAIVKLGPDGVLAQTRDESVHVKSIPVTVVNGLGAGDGFGGALCHGLLSGWSLEKTLQTANAAGSIVASRLSCSDAMPTIEEIDEALERTNRA